MAADERTPEQIRGEIAAERERLVEAVVHARAELREATDVSARLRPHLPLVAAGAFGAAFVAAGGIGASMRFLARRSRERRRLAALGGYGLVKRD